MLPSTTLNHKACAKYLPVLLCTADLAPALCTSHSTWHTSHSTPHSTLNTLHSTLHSPHSTLHTSHCTRHTPHSTLDTSHFTVRSTLNNHTLHFTLLTPQDASGCHKVPRLPVEMHLHNFEQLQKHHHLWHSPTDRPIAATWRRLLGLCITTCWMPQSTTLATRNALAQLDTHHLLWHSPYTVETWDETGRKHSSTPKSPY